MSSLVGLAASISRNGIEWAVAFFGLAAIEATFLGVTGSAVFFSETAFIVAGAIALIISECPLQNVRTTRK
jgi:hypothetical protein